ncbi:MAG: hypothetical protein NC313_15535, partial [Butyrivibrio sp.]|nr:hypothetical protein [Butyrivibrio sp.]
QQESQLAMNQISDVIIDTTRSVNYVGYSSDGSVSEQAVKDADFTIDVEDKSLTLFNGEGKVKVDASGNPVLDADGNPEIEKLLDGSGNPVLNADGTPKLDITGGNGNKNYQIYWDKSEEKLYYSEIDISETDFPEGDRVVLAEFVKDFSVDLSQVEEKRVVSIAISYEYNNRIYETSNNITIRNKVLVNNVNLAVNRSVELNIRPKENMVILEPLELGDLGNNYYRFSTPVIDGKNVIDKSVTWSIPDEEKAKLTDPANTKFRDAANGIIQISSAERANSFTVKVMTNAVDSAGNHAEADVIVYVKRVKNVSLSKKDDSDTENGSLEISAGCTFTINASVEGTQLGYTCSNCGDNVDIDKYVVAGKGTGSGWWVEDPDGIVDASWTCDNGKAQFAISSSAQPGQTIKIWATSLLSVTGNSHHRKYTDLSGAAAPEFGWIELKVANHNRDITADGPFKYGDEPLTLTWDYEGSTAVICLRVKERGVANAEEKVMIINSDGKALRVGADVMGLDLNKSYDINMQVLACELNKYASDYETKRNELVTEYNGHLDSTGTYIGTKYKASSLLPIGLDRPEITITYNNTEYKGEEVNIAPIYSLRGGVEISCNITNVSITRNSAERVKNASKANLYTSSNKELYVYDEKTKNYVDYTGNNGIGALQFSDCQMHSAQSLKVKLEGNKSLEEAEGSYYYVPFFTYENGTDASRFVVHYISDNYKPDYGLHYYYRPESRVNFSIVSGGNLALWANTNTENNNFVKGEIYFPTPSEYGFRNYFTLNNPAEQSVTLSYNNNFKILAEDGSTDKSVSITRMTCRYLPTEDKYIIGLFYECKDLLRDAKVEMSAGTFSCSATGTMWDPLEPGTLDAQLKAGNTTVILNGNTWIKIDNKGFNAYIPLPDENKFKNEWNGNFGFKLDYIKNHPGEKVETTTISASQAKISYVTTENGSPCVKSIACSEAYCTYDADTRTYTLEMHYYNPNNSNTSELLGTFTYKEGETEWKAAVN